MMLRSKWLAAVSGISLAVAPSVVQAAPVGTAAGSDITNTVQVDYKVGGVSQTQVSATDTFKVDRKVNVTVATTDASAVSVSPGQTDAVTTFTVTNNSNATLDFLLAATNQSGGSAQFSGSDSFDGANVRVYVETNGTPGWQTDDTQAGALAGIASGDTATVYVLADMVLSAGPPAALPTNGSIATVVLTATAASGASQIGGTVAGSGGSAISQTPPGTANGQTTMETVFADAAYAPSGDTAYNGQHAARSDYQVAGALLSVNKYSRVVSDPVGSTNPRSIPGAVVEYCIVVSNASGAATAADVALSDVVPTEMTFVSGSVYLDGAFSAPDTCTSSGGSAGSDAANYNAGTTTVSNTFASIAATETRTLRFQATIN
ncbi:hypothetical protein N0B51_06500 [Tsuneonella sp. YG55]|uniref:DUF11 domain-containing protein n=1 Tax=Tsuneonella litorea TaxID=2976475 RepID=A0A9X2W2E7_9SPHN|nr:hypothetical protein [Tsuneonella litorea]MCT2558626.1 hypothetical protein [Tsuneonella litorea]